MRSQVNNVSWNEKEKWMNEDDGTLEAKMNGAVREWDVLWCGGEWNQCDCEHDSAVITITWMDFAPLRYYNLCMYAARGTVFAQLKALWYS